MPKDLGEVPSATAENEQIAAVWVTLESLLNLQGQPLHATAHICMTGRDPDPTTRWNRDQDRSAVNTRRSAARLTSRPTRTRCPSPSSISIRSDRVFQRVEGVRSTSLAEDIGCFGVSNSRTGTNAGLSVSLKLPSRA
jgi:hypothetical protein